MLIEEQAEGGDMLAVRSRAARRLSWPATRAWPKAAAWRSTGGDSRIQYAS
ncbi:MAG: hypothetical protein MZV64_73410 [Ignavibacteriales bacterium]|nr:hypothetical protein [Ignavibacteriales bacterium]